MNTKVNNNELAPNYDIRKQVLNDYPDLDWDETQTLAIDMTCAKQAEDLRAIAHAIETTGIPITSPHLMISTRYAGTDKEAIRRQAKLGVEFIKACNADVKKINSDYSWGVEGVLASSIKVGFSVFNEATCEYVPVLDDDGNTQMVTSTKMVSVDIQETLTEKKCMPIFTKDEDYHDAN